MKECLKYLPDVYYQWHILNRSLTSFYVSTNTPIHFLNISHCFWTLLIRLLFKIITLYYQIKNISNTYPCAISSLADAHRSTSVIPLLPEVSKHKLCACVHVTLTTNWINEISFAFDEMWTLLRFYKYILSFSKHAHYLYLYINSLYNKDTKFILISQDRESQRVRIYFRFWDNLCFVFTWFAEGFCTCGSYLSPPELWRWCWEAESIKAEELFCRRGWRERETPAQSLLLQMVYKSNLLITPTGFKLLQILKTCAERWTSQ